LLANAGYAEICSEKEIYGFIIAIELAMFACGSSSSVLIQPRKGTVLDRVRGTHGRSLRAGSARLDQDHE